MQAPAHGFVHSDPVWRAWLNAQLAELLALPVDDIASIQGSDNLLSWGLDSIRLMSIQTRLQAQGVALEFSALSQTPNLDAWLQLLRPHTGPHKPSHAPHTAHPTGDMRPAEHTPFALTPVQEAYWLGRQRSEVLGNVSCHAFLVFHARQVDAQRLKTACSQVRQRHPMLRAAFQLEGQQRILQAPTAPVFLEEDWRPLDAATAEQRWLALWSQRSHESLDVSAGQVFLLGLVHMPTGEDRLWLSTDLLAADVLSLRLLLSDLGAAYARPGHLPPPPLSSFETHVRNGGSHPRSAIERDRAYWHARLDTLPAGPALPLACTPASVRQPVFRRRSFHLPPADLARLETKAAQAGLTLASVFGSAWIAILGRWSEQARFLLNVPVFNRPEHGDLHQVIGDFTQLLLMPCETRAQESLEAAARRFQSDLHEALSHSAYPALELLREARRRGLKLEAPVVFSFNLDGEPFVPESFRSAFGDLHSMISQTPQVWLDHQVYRIAEGALLAWDSVDALFPPGMLDDMFDAYVSLMQHICDASWQNVLVVPLPEAQARCRQQINALPLPGPRQCLHDDFFALAQSAPSLPALHAQGQILTHGELRHAALCVAGGLRAQGLRNGDAVEICLPRGISQVVAVLGVLAAGGCYVPIDPSQPEARRSRIRASAGIQIVITEHPDAACDLPQHQAQTLLTSPPLSEPLPVDPRQSAYVIYTSGSTGVPKGVEVSHAAAQNTLHAMRALLSLNHSDRLLAVSALDFDLSVFDIFGVLGAGGSLILLSADEARDPHHWLSLARAAPPTLWNSAPALLEMLLALPDAAQAFTCLRASLLSGDWIRQDLPQRLAKLAPPGHRFHALGGATEAGIWSNVHVAQAPRDGWRSIPYGKPLPGQAFRVVDPLGRDTPDLVPGELWIGGASLARGYRGDPELSAQRFVNETDGSRWYRTGDRGRYHSDGTLEFLGRTDQQIKLRGVRIELGELESVLQTHPDLEACCAWVQPQPHPHLVAAVTLAHAQAEALEEGRTPPKAPSVTSSPIPVRPHSATSLEAEALLATAVLQPLLRDPAVIHTHAGKVWAQWLERHAALSSHTAGDPPWHLMNWTEADVNVLRSRLRDWACRFSIQDEAASVMEEVLLDALLAPQALAATWVAGQAVLDDMATALHALCTEANAPLRIAIHGVRAGQMLLPLLALLDQPSISLTLMDESPTLLDAARARFVHTHPQVQVWPSPSLVPMNWVGHHDVVLSFATLHTIDGADDAVWALCMLLREGGHLLLADLLRDSPLRQLTRPFLEPITADASAHPPGVFCDPNELDSLADLRLQPDSWRDDKVFVVHACQLHSGPRPPELSAWLATQLPTSMRPEELWLMRSLPLNANGKVDRRKLSMLTLDQGIPPRQDVAPADQFIPRNTEEAHALAAWKSLLGMPSDAPAARQDNFFERGGDSLGATRLLVRLREAVARPLSLARFYRDPTLAGLADQLAQTPNGPPTAQAENGTWTEGAL